MVISERIDASDLADQQIWVDVWFKTKAGRIAHATVQPYPYAFGKVTRGQEIPILYNANMPSQAAYAGRGGDDTQPFGVGALEWPAYIGAVLWFSLAAALLLSGLSRFAGNTRASLTDVVTPVHLRVLDGVAYVDQSASGYGLEWRVLPSQPEMSGDVCILGELTSGRWIAVRLGDGRFVWPASTAYPILASAGLRLPTVSPGFAGSARLLLAGYAQVFDLLGTLPVALRRLPESKAQWVFGALRPMVKTLVTSHVRRRLAPLRSALLRAAFLCDESDPQGRRALIGASDECQKFIEALPRRGIIVLLATIAATTLSIISPFLLLPHIAPSTGFITQYMPLISLGFLIFGTVPVLMFFRSIRWKRALFNPPSHGTGQTISPTASVKPSWDVYELERSAFAAAKAPRPREWESWESIRWLAFVIYSVVVSIPFFLGLSISAFPIASLNGNTILPFLGIIAILLYRLRKRERRLHGVA